MIFFFFFSRICLSFIDFNMIFFCFILIQGDLYIGNCGHGMNEKVLSLDYWSRWNSSMFFIFCLLVPMRALGYVKWVMIFLMIFCLLVMKIYDLILLDPTKFGIVVIWTMKKTSPCRLMFVFTLVFCAILYRLFSEWLFIFFVFI